MRLEGILKKAKSERKGNDMIHNLARKLYALIRLHSKMKKEQLKAKLNLEARKARRECTRSIWKFAAKILDGENDSVTPTFSPEAESYFKRVYSSSPKEFQRPEWLPAVHPPQVAFNDDPSSISEINEAIRHTKSSSSPSSIDRISYCVLKNCPALLEALIDLYNACWESQTAPSAWK